MKITITALLLCLVVPVARGSDTIPSRLSIEYGQDSADGEDYFVSADIDLAGPRLYLGYGESDAQSGSTILNTETRLVELSSNPLDDMSLGLSYSEWGQEGEINIETWRLNLYFNSQDWTVLVAPQTRDIALHTLVSARPVINFDSNGINLGLSYFGLSPLALSLNYSYHDYSRNVASLASDPRLVLIFSPATMEHAYGFEEQRWSAAMSLAFDWGSLGLDGARSVSAVDDSVSTSIAAAVRYYLTGQWDIRLRAGKSDNSFSTDEVTFASLALAYRF